ncbi:hypothetical protein PV10_07521 [Exophiala mesophila]|uniref:Peptidase S54 rhomboid domain-containing protein n=1 Tax=Exophiala mesophila TaxID=212818 RepID=A0A0D1WME6_EXOME|nr:uncharacterized protein PV10_07521 [Exophiala mesophila]KIV90190.1 hypothetical protein PV10_07521 [Exophiala mesophila]
MDHSQKVAVNRSILNACFSSCVGISLAWGWANGTLQESLPIPPALAGTPQRRRKVREVLERDFLLKLDGAQPPNWWTMVTAAFSHQRLNHLLGNLSGFEIFSEALISMGMTPVHYLGLIFGSAIFANVSFWRLRKASSRRRISSAYALGLSGVVSALGAAAACAIPNAPTRILRFQKGVPLWVVLAGYTLYDTLMLGNVNSTTGHAAHLAGSLFGVLYYYFVLSGNLPLIRRFRRPTRSASTPSILALSRA